MARKKEPENKPDEKIDVPVENQTNSAVGVYPKVNTKPTLQEKMERELSPAKAQDAVLFRGAGIKIYTLFVGERKEKKEFCVDFGPMFMYPATDADLIDALRKDGYKEIKYWL